MKKTKIIAMMITIISLLSFSVVFADQFTKPEGFSVTTPSGTEGVVGIAGTVVGAIKMIGYFIAVGMIIYIGIKYLMASASEKADLKGLLVKYCIGAALIVGGVTIADWIFSLSL